MTSSNPVVVSVVSVVVVYMLGIQGVVCTEFNTRLTHLADTVLGAKYMQVTHIHILAV